MDDELRAAIQQRRLVEFRYQGLLRVAEPHLLGMIKTKKMLLIFQIGGLSRSGTLPDWRTVEVSKMSELTVLEDLFPGPRPEVSGSRSKFTTVWTVVQ